MSVRRNASLVAVGGLVAQASVVVRGVLVARLIGPDNMGIAAAFFAVMAFIDTLSESGADAYLAQPGVASPRDAARTTQGIALVRGVVCALILLAIAVPASRSFEAPEAVAGFLAIAAVPFLRGFLSHDLYVQQRLARPRSMIAAEVWSQVLSLGLGIGVAWWVGDWWAAVAALLGQTLALVIASHAYAESPWRIGFDRAVMRSSVAFGLPLLAASIAMFLSQQGDRVMIGVAPAWFGVDYTKADLGRYAVAASLAILPIRICVLLLRSVFMQWMVAAEGVHETRRRRRITLVCFGLIGVAYAIFSSTIAGDLLGLLVGPEYGDLHLLVAALCTAQAVRILRFQTNAVALAAGRSGEVMIGGVVRLLGVAFALPAVMLGLRVEWIGLAAVVGELVAVAATDWRLVRLGLGFGGIRYSPTVWALAMIAAAGGCAALVPALGGSLVLLATTLLAAAAAILVRRMHPELWAQFQGFVELVRRRRRGGVPATRDEVA